MQLDGDVSLTAHLAQPASRRNLIAAVPSTRALLLYGLVVAVLGGALLFAAAPSHWSIESSRATSLQGALRELDNGGPPLTARYPRAGGGYTLAATSPGDDQGIFVYVPGIAHVLGLSNALSAMRILFVIMFFAPLLLYPLLFARLFDSLVAGLIAPWGLLACLLALGFRDVLWITEWAVLALLPPLMLLDRRWHRWGIAWLLVVMVGASFANSIRSQSGLGVALAVLIVVLKRPWRWRWRLALIVPLLVAYLSITTFGFAGLRSWRASDVGLRATETGNSHLVWHPIFLGLGYMPNRYDLHWSDSEAIAVVHAYRPSLRYPTAAYDAAVRHIFFQLVSRDPGLLLRSVADKLLVVLLFSVPALVVLLLAGVVMASEPRRASPALRCLILLVPPLLVGLVPPLLGVPEMMYELGWLASLCLACIVALTWLVAQLIPSTGTNAAMPLAAMANSARGWLGHSRLRVAAMAVTVLALLAVGLAGYHVRQRASSWKAATPAVPKVHGVL